MSRMNHLRWLLLPVLLALVPAGALRADTYLPDTLRAESGHTLTLTPAGSPYICDTTTVLLPRDTLRILPGTTLRFAGNVGLVVNGTLLAEGVRDSLIHFESQEGAAIRWQGLQMRYLPLPDSTGVLPDTTVSRLRYCRIAGANTVLNVMSKPVAAGDEYCVELERCFVHNSTLGLVTFTPGRFKIHNCLFDEIATFALYSSGALVDVRNTIFLPHSINTWAYGILLFNPPFEISQRVQYNCFYSGPEGAWTNFINYYFTGDTQYTEVTPDSTHVVGDPMLDENLVPMDGSPVIDAGDPNTLDEDLTIADMGVFYALGELTPCRILTPPANPDWVVGFFYLGVVGMEAYPPATWTLSGAPSGMAMVQLNREQLGIYWPQDRQYPGQFAVRIHGVNQYNDVAYRDSMDVVFDFAPNHPPRVVQVEPCSSGDCLGQSLVRVDHLSAGEIAQVRLRIADEDAPRLGAGQRYWFYSRLDGRDQPILQADSLWLDLPLDTAAVVLETWFSDGLAADTLRLVLDPRYALLSGEYTGSIGAATGAVYLVGPLTVPADGTLRVEAGSRVLSGRDLVDDWVVDVMGELVLEGTAEEPVVFSSMAAHTEERDERPAFLRLQPGSRVGEIAHAEFHGFSTAIQLEHLGNEEALPIHDCLFATDRVGILAVDTPVEITRCRFVRPADSLMLGSSSVYLASSQDNRVQNNLFVNPIVGLSVVDGEALVANNSFLVVPDWDPYYNIERWPHYTQLGFGRIQVLNSSLDVRNNLFQWRSQLFGNIFSEPLLEQFLASRPRALWLDEASEVAFAYNWLDCRNGWLHQGDTLLVNASHMIAFNDSLRLAAYLPAGQDSARVDEASGFRLFADSPLIDAGDPDPAWNDTFDGSRADIGWTGGPLALEGGYTPVSGHGEGGGAPAVALPNSFRLRPPQPNPFNPRTRLVVDLDRPGLLDLRVYDLLGREVAALVRDRLEPGTYQVHLDAGAWASGVYFARASFAGQVQTARLLLVK